MEIFGINFESGHAFAMFIVCLLTLACSNLFDMLKLIFGARRERKAKSKEQSPDISDTLQTSEAPGKEQEYELNIDTSSLTSSQRLALAELESIDNKIRLLNESKKHYLRKLKNGGANKIRSTK